MSATAAIKKMEERIANTYIILVVTQGFVYTGNVESLDEGHIVVNQAFNIRQWGTDKGLGQLAVEGKQSGTVLDDCGIVIVPYQQIVSILPCAHQLKN